MRKAISKTEKIPAALLAIKRGDEWLIPEPLRSCGDAAKIAASVEWHHNVPVAFGGRNTPENLIPLMPEVHAKETATRTVPAVAKVKRLAPEHEAFRRRLLAKAGQGQVAEAPAPRAKIKSRPMPFGRQSRLKKTMSGKVIER